jgi:hypothetical protein
VFLALLAMPELQAQELWHARNYDRRKFNLGFTLGINLANVKFKYGDLVLNNRRNEGLRDISATIAPGFFIGLIANVKLFRNWDLRFVPSVSLTQRNFAYQVRDSIFKRKLEASYLELPLFIKFKSDLYRNYRVYVMAGPKLSVNLVSDKDVKDNPNVLKIERIDYSIDVAFGIDLYGDRIKLSPEIRYSLGLRNVILGENTLYGRNITSLNVQSITICLNFE